MAGSITKADLRYLRFLAKLTGNALPRIAVETGTYRGAGTKVLSGYFETVHTIELSEEWFQFASKELDDYPNVQCHQGESADVLADRFREVVEPILFVLDAHYSGGTTALGKQEVPLLAELEVICKRQQRDVVVIDDIRLLGTKGVCGHADDPIYPLADYDWSDVTRDKISAIIGKQCGWYYRLDRAYVFLGQTAFKRSCFKKINSMLAHTRRILHPKPIS